MRLGLGPIGLADAEPAALREFAIDATAASFDSVWVGESRGDGVGGGMAAAAFIAQAAPIRAGVALAIGLYHPLYLAEDIAVADLTSGGRLEVLLRLPTPAEVERYGSSADRGWYEENLSLLSAALAGAHLSWDGAQLKVPGQLEANQPVPKRLALNPAPAQPALPIWLAAEGSWAQELAMRLGFGIAREWTAGADTPPSSGRLPGMLLCPPDAGAADLLAAAGERSGYFLVAAKSAAGVADAGRRLAGPLRMPEFPAWINA